MRNTVSWRLSLKFWESIALYEGLCCYLLFSSSLSYTRWWTHTREGSPSLLHWMNQITKWIINKQGTRAKKEFQVKTTIFSPHSGSPAGGNLGLCETWPKIRSPVGYAQERHQYPQRAGFLSVTGIPLLQTSRAPLFSLSYQNVLTTSLKLFFPVCVPFPWSSSLWGDPSQHPETGPQLPTLSSLSTVAWGSFLGPRCWLSFPLFPWKLLR